MHKAHIKKGVKDRKSNTVSVRVCERKYGRAQEKDRESTGEKDDKGWDVQSNLRE